VAICSGDGSGFVTGILTLREVFQGYRRRSSAEGPTTAVTDEFTCSRDGIPRGSRT
jgi:hypothetical protein